MTIQLKTVDHVLVITAGHDIKVFLFHIGQYRPRRASYPMSVKSSQSRVRLVAVTAQVGPRAVCCRMLQ